MSSNNASQVLPNNPTTPDDANDAKDDAAPPKESLKRAAQEVRPLKAVSRKSLQFLSFFCFLFEFQFSEDSNSVLEANEAADSAQKKQKTRENGTEEESNDANEPEAGRSALSSFRHLLSLQLA